MNNDKYFRGTARDVGVKVRVVRVCFVGAKGALTAVYCYGTGGVKVRIVRVLSVGAEESISYYNTVMVPAVIRLELLGFVLWGHEGASAVTAMVAVLNLEAG